VPIGLLLKPITKTTLSAFLEQAVALCVAGAGRADPGSGGNPSGDRDDILQSLLQANLRLQEYDQDRTNFLARAVHDFRAPLTALNGYCGLMLEGALGPFSPDQKEVLQRMQRSAQRLTRMASSLYDLSVARRLPLRMQPQPHAIEDCVEQAIHELACVADEKHISITVQLTVPGDLALCFDPVRIEQLLANVLDNACKFTPRFGAIEVSGFPYFWDRRSRATPIPMDRRGRKCEEPNSFRLNIRDSGPEVPEEVLPLIFEEYTSYSGPEDRSAAGLGLAICRIIARAHQGDIWASSEADGAMFSLVLPLQSSDRPPDPPRCEPHALAERI
jgi:two-component system sensor histidine kinase ResE